MTDTMCFVLNVGLTGWLLICYGCEGNFFSYSGVGTYNHIYGWDFVYFVSLSAVAYTSNSVYGVCGLCYDRVSFIGLHVHSNIDARSYIYALYLFLLVQAIMAMYSSVWFLYLLGKTVECS